MGKHCITHVIEEMMQRSKRGHSLWHLLTSACFSSQSFGEDIKFTWNRAGNKTIYSFNCCTTQLHQPGITSPGTDTETFKGCAMQSV